MYLISITVDDKVPIWMKKTIKSEIKAKNVLYKKMYSE